MWIALFASVMMYIPVHFWVKGYFPVYDKKWYKFRFARSNVDSEQLAEQTQQRRATLGLLL